MRETAMARQNLASVEIADPVVHRLAFATRASTIARTGSGLWCHGGGERDDG
jgi:hypothetical protein